MNKSFNLEIVKVINPCVKPSKILCQAVKSEFIHKYYGK